MPFQPGNAGRPRGAKNKRGSVAELTCRALVDNPAYRKDFAKRLHAGQLAPALEAMVWYYAHGKPAESIEHSGEVRMPAQVIFELHRSTP